jgi:hypothetical protein
VLCVCDAHESVFFFKVVPMSQTAAMGSALSGYNNALALQQRPVAIRFADDVVPRHISCCCFVDPMTVAVADRFGSIALLRFTSEALAFATALQKSAQSALALEDTSTASSEGRRLRGAPRKVVEVAHFFVGQTVVSLDIEPVSKISASAAAVAAAAASLDDQSAAGSSSSSALVNNSAALYYATALGKIGALLPLSTNDYQHLVRVERTLSAELQPLLGRDHHAYRSSFAPSVGVVDLSYVQHAWRSKRGAVEDVIADETDVAQNRARMAQLPVVAARRLETGVSEVRARCLGMIADS